jgi:TRAP-type mannitol/chloroaromatic compound transport system substrate-binding protein
MRKTIYSNQLNISKSSFNFKSLNKTPSKFMTISTNQNKSKWPVEWNLESVWPKSLINNEVVDKFKENIENMTDNKWKINIKYGVNKDLAFENVQKQKTHMIIGHSTYWNGLPPAASFFASIPFGMSRSEFLAWINFGGGKHYWEKLYEPLGLFPILAGDTGMQMGGWFPKQMNSPHDFKGMKMRIEGLGGNVLEKLGLKVVNAPASKLLSMIDSGELDSCEFATPVMDESAGIV